MNHDQPQGPGEETPSERMQTLRKVLMKMEDQIVAALPRHVTQERFVRVMLTTIRRNPKLQECTIMSVLGAMMCAAQDGLELDGVQAALVPYRDHGKMEAHYQPMYRGLLAMARRSGEVSSVRARAVYQGDIFEYEDGLEPKLRHVRGDNEDEAAITHFYAVVDLRDGGKHFEVMTRGQVDAIRDSAASYRLKPDESPWTTDYPPMGCKTVARRALKWSPTAAEFQRAITRHELMERGQLQAASALEQPLVLPEGVAYERPPQQPPGDKAADLAAQVRARTAAQKEASPPEPAPKPGPRGRPRAEAPKPRPAGGAETAPPKQDEPPLPDVPPPGDDQGVIPGF